MRCSNAALAAGGLNRPLIGRRSRTTATGRARVVAETRAWFDTHPEEAQGIVGALRAAGDRMSFIAEVIKYGTADCCAMKLAIDT
jgi:hypothetical protein